MTLADVSQVVAIDRVSFHTPWSARSYAYEVSESTYSHMVTLELSFESPISGWRRFLHRANGSLAAIETKRQVIGYGGLWSISGESHISTIATHPDFRRQGYGEILLAAMTRRSITLGAEYIVLEVRVSNTPAQELYFKYGYEVVDVKQGYYHDDGEDAYDMRLSLDQNGVSQRVDACFKKLRAKFAFADLFTNTERP
jgi:ribosomal-protein-alanine N-acetyltransferase